MLQEGAEHGKTSDILPATATVFPPDTQQAPICSPEEHTPSESLQDLKKNLEVVLGATMQKPKRQDSNTVIILKPEGKGAPMARTGAPNLLEFSVYAKFLPWCDHRIIDIFCLQ